MKLLPILLVTLSLLEVTPCFQTCLVDLVKRLFAPKNPSANLPAEPRLALLNRLQNASKSPKNALNEKGKINDVPIIRRGVDVIMEGSTTTTTIKPNQTGRSVDPNEIRNNITVITRSEVDVITEGDAADADADARFNDDLLDSFGGLNEEENFEDVESPKDGMYFLLDWNTFLEVDDQNGRRVNLRVQPKVGDPKQFIDVTVP